MAYNPIYTVDDLLELPPEEFVEACYRSFLYRQPDPQGLAHYVGRVAKGEAKLTVAADIGSSDEARALPPFKKRFTAEVLARQLAVVIGSARTSTARNTAARKAIAYFSVLAGSELAASADSTAAGVTRDQHDPFSTYLVGVIEDRS